MPDNHNGANADTIEKLKKIAEAVAACVAALGAIVTSFKDIFGPEATALVGIVCALVLVGIAHHYRRHPSALISVPARVGKLVGVGLLVWLVLLILARLQGPPSPWGVEAAPSRNLPPFVLKEISKNGNHSVAAGEESIESLPIESDKLLVRFGVSGSNRDTLNKLQIESIVPSEGVQTLTIADSLEAGIVVDRSSLTDVQLSNIKIRFAAIGKDNAELTPITVIVEARFYNVTKWWRFRVWLYKWYDHRQ